MSSKAASESPGGSDYQTAASDDNADNATPQPRHVEPPRNLSGFWKLPKELRDRILSIACTTDILHRYDKIGRAGDCTKTIIRLSQASRYFYAFATPLLYAHVRLDRPSALRLFHQALASRPALGRLVKSLHIGPQEAVPEYWWPIRNFDYSGKDDYAFRVNLVDSVDDPSRPWWACPSHDLRYDVEADCPSRWAKAIGDAFDAASRDLDVDIRHEKMDYSGRPIESDAWHVRVMEVQGAMELYSFYTHRRDVQEKEERGLEGPASWYELKGPYARLVVGNRMPQSLADGKDDNIFRVSRYEIYQRLTRRRTPADHFNHPLLFARSGLSWEAEGPNDILHRSDGSNPANLSADDPANLFSWPNTGTSASVVNEGDTDEAAPAFPFDLSDSIDPAVPNTVTVGGNLALARSVLALTPLLSTLSLTGYLQFAVVSERAPPAFEELRFVTLGPHRCWGRWLRYGHSTFEKVEKLRICGGVLALEEIEDIVGGSTLPSLREFYWSDVNQVCDGDEEHLILMIKNLIDFEDSAAEEATNNNSSGQSHKRRRAARKKLDDLRSAKEESEDESDEEREEEDPSQLSNEPRDNALYIEVHLHPGDAKTVIKQAPSRAVAKAWCSGRRVPGQRHRLHLFRHPEAKSNGIAWGVNLQMGPLFAEGRAFGEKAANVFIRLIPLDIATTSIIDAISWLISLNREQAGADTSELSGQARKRLRMEREQESSEDSHTSPEQHQRASTPSRQRSEPILIELILHEEDAKAVLDAAPTPEVGHAWRHGKAVSGQRHRLQVRSHTDAPGGLLLTWAINDETRDLFQRGKEWWEGA